MGEWFRAIGDWLSEWNNPGTLGDVLPWLATSLVTLVSALILWLRRRAQQRREQALQVTAWVDESHQDGSVARVRNSSRNRIEHVAVLVARMAAEPRESADWDHDAQFFTCLTLGPERTITFPLRDAWDGAGHFQVRLYFSDSAGRAWVLGEDGVLTKSKGPVAESFFGGTSTGQTADLTDHSGTVDSDGNPIAILSVPLQRLDVDPKDGTSISLILLPKGKLVEPTTIAELTGDDGRRLARAYLDADDHILRLTVCNLPRDTRKYCIPRYVFAEKYTVLFGSPEQDVNDIVSSFEIADAWVLGGRHTPWNEMAHIAYDERGHLRAIMFNKRNLTPGFLHKSVR